MGVAAVESARMRKVRRGCELAVLEALLVRPPGTTGTPLLEKTRGEPLGTVPATMRSSSARPTKSFHARSACASSASASCRQLPSRATASIELPPAQALPPVGSAASAGNERGTSAHHRTRYCSASWRPA